MARRLESILDECLERMLGGESIEACLNAYPEQTSELEPLLRTSHVFIRKSMAIQPAPEFKARVYSRLQAMFYAKEEKAERRARIPIWRRGWALATTAILGFLLIGGGTIAASAHALPDEPLYPVKLTGEQVRLILTFSDVGEAKLHIQFAERRADEMLEMASQGKNGKISMLTEQITNHLDKAYMMVGIQIAGEGESRVLAPAPPSSSEAETYSEGKVAGELETLLRQSHAKSLATLRNALDKAPEELKPVLQQAIEGIGEDYDETISIVGNGSSQ